MAIEAVYIFRLPLVMDEFAGAAAVHRLTRELPYRDFAPYKTVLGYYIQLPALIAAQASGMGLWGGLMLVKLWMASLTAATLGWASLRLRHRFAPGAVLLCLALLVSMSTFLERSAALRVDMLTSLAGLVSLVLLIECRSFTAGILAGVSFLISQKGSLYVAAGVVGLAAGTAMSTDDRRARALRLCSFTGGLASSLAVYYGLWVSLSSGFGPLTGTLEPAISVLGADYSIKLRFWSQTILRNPLFYGLAALALARLLSRIPAATFTQRMELAAYAGTIVGLCIWYAQPWPYFFVLMLPTLWVVLITLFDELLERDGSGQLALLDYLTLAFVVMLGVAYPLASRVPVNLGRDSSYQRSVLELADQLVGPNESYLAGVDLLYDRRQSPARFAWLDRPRRSDLAHLQGPDLEEVRQELAEAPLKVLIDNYRLRELPSVLRDELDRKFRHIFGHVAIYSPCVSAGETEVDVAFSGAYTLAAAASCLIDGRTVESGERIPLEAGSHFLHCPLEARLDLDPGVDIPTQAAELELFPNPYSY